jgi:hypothetical protein
MWLMSLLIGGLNGIEQVAPVIEGVEHALYTIAVDVYCDIPRLNTLSEIYTAYTMTRKA